MMSIPVKAATFCRKQNQKLVHCIREVGNSQFFPLAQLANVFFLIKNYFF